MRLLCERFDPIRVPATAYIGGYMISEESRYHLPYEQPFIVVLIELLKTLEKRRQCAAFGPKKLLHMRPFLSRCTTVLPLPPGGGRLGWDGGLPAVLALTPTLATYAHTPGPSSSP